MVVGTNATKFIEEFVYRFQGNEETYKNQSKNITIPGFFFGADVFFFFTDSIPWKTTLSALHSS